MVLLCAAFSVLKSIEKLETSGENERTMSQAGKQFPSCHHHSSFLRKSGNFFGFVHASVAGSSATWI